MFKYLHYTYVNTANIYNKTVFFIYAHACTLPRYYRLVVAYSKYLTILGTEIELMQIKKLLFIIS